MPEPHCRMAERKEMNMSKMIIKNGALVSSSKVCQKDIYIENGKIKAIGEPGDFLDEEKNAEEIYDAKGNYVLPGLIEPHMHIKAPLGGIVDILDFDSASVCAAYGGVTTFMDFSSTLPGDSLKAAVKTRREEMQISKLDYSLHCKVVNLADAQDIAGAMAAEAAFAKDKNERTMAAVKEANERVNSQVKARLEEIPDIVKNGKIPTFKLFMTYRKANVMIDDVSMLKVMAAVRDAGGRCGFHAESNAIAEYNEELFEKEGKLDWSYFAEYKGNLCEAEAVRRVLYYAQLLKAPVYFFHLSTREAIEAVKEARKKGVDVIAETCCHYLAFTKEKNEGKDGILYLMSPPLRTKDDQEALWQAVKNDDIKIVSSDNCTFPRAMKEAPLTDNKPDFRKPISGVSGLEERFGVLMRAVNEGKIGIQDLVRVACENPAIYFGCGNRKGFLKDGYDADIVIVDRMKRVTLNRESLHYPEQLEYALYEDFEVTGYPVTTIRRGEYLVKDGVYNENASLGLFIERELV